MGILLIEVKEIEPRRFEIEMDADINHAELLSVICNLQSYLLLNVDKGITGETCEFLIQELQFALQNRRNLELIQRGFVSPPDRRTALDYDGQHPPQAIGLPSPGEVIQDLGTIRTMPGEIWQFKET